MASTIYQYRVEHRSPTQRADELAEWLNLIASSGWKFMGAENGLYFFERQQLEIKMSFQTRTTVPCDELEQLRAIAASAKKLDDMNIIWKGLTPEQWEVLTELMGHFHGGVVRR